MKKYYFNSDLRFSVKEEKNSENLKANQIRVRMRNCGICGSDIHYYLHGENGGRKIMEPLMLGHEAVGEILEVGSNLEQFKKDDRISINPALYCYKCKFCKTKKFNLCENVLFFGSAAKMPHTQGAFREQIIVDKSQCHLIDANTSFEEAAFAEPLAVALHASSFIKNNNNQNILIAGCGPIGLLLLKILIQQTAEKNYFDVSFEASGNVNSINNIIDMAKRGSNIIQIGNMPGGLIKINYNKVMTKELKILGSYRFSEEFNIAVNKINNKEFIFKDILTHKFKLEDCDEAMKIASDKNKSIKVQVFN